MAHLTALKDSKEFIDLTTGNVYADPEGLRLVREMVPTDYVLGDKGQPIRDGMGRPVHVRLLENVANKHYAQGVANTFGKGVKVNAKDDDGRLFTMDLAPSDVHTNATLPNYAAGYHLAGGIADLASPVVMVPKQADVYYTWSKESDFNRKIPNASSPGGGVAEVNPGLAPSTYTTVEYALAGFLPTEVQSNADTPLRPFTKMVQIVVDGLKLEREFRVATLLQTSGNWGTNQVTTIAAGAQWDNGASADPVLNLHTAIEQSFMPVTDIVMSELLVHDFIRSPAVQKFFTYKDSVNGIPVPFGQQDLNELSGTLGLPPIRVGFMKYLVGGAIKYVWGNHCTLLHVPSETPPTSQMEVATSYTFRWNGGTAPDGTLTGGLLVRTFYDPKRGPRGGTQVVVVMNDFEAQTSGFVGGLLLNAHQ